MKIPWTTSWGERGTDITTLDDVELIGLEQWLTGAVRDWPRRRRPRGYRLVSAIRRELKTREEREPEVRARHPHSGAVERALAVLLGDCVLPPALLQGEQRRARQKLDRLLHAGRTVDQALKVANWARRAYVSGYDRFHPNLCLWYIWTLPRFDDYFLKTLDPRSRQWSDYFDAHVLPRKKGLPGENDVRICEEYPEVVVQDHDVPGPEQRARHP